MRKVESESSDYDSEDDVPQPKTRKDKKRSGKRSKKEEPKAEVVDLLDMGSAPEQKQDSAFDFLGGAQTS